MQRWSGLALVVALADVMIMSSRPAIEAASAQDQRITWYVVDGAMNGKGQSLNLGDGQQAVRLSNGWLCTVGPTSKQLPTYEARTTICEKGSEAFQFVVQCERTRARDHTQIGFLNSNRRPGEFIEVGCELK